MFDFFQDVGRHAFLQYALLAGVLYHLAGLGGGIIASIGQTQRAEQADSGSAHDDADQKAADATHGSSPLHVLCGGAGQPALLSP